ncbi:DUF599 domain-containing protein [Jannaschia seohaensis]|uniref:Putative membrane protein n=1 Tax=Jannaschia seohaensis TaxID=475081 RepID=A0A2Y9ARC8_9RHOB|nr:DUF599 domain-containing protein [Jannaschia seohaensis]PWJ18110.1 putative membrane protein [Jannaschia seohaensis]SSA46635.1 Uncharacterized membrane protein [Jannaschia seohaensis]
MLAVLPVPLTPPDLLALAVLLLAWIGSGWVIEHPPPGRASVTRLMQAYRRDWMVEMTTRQPRIFDATILASLRQGTTFLTSAAMISVGGVLALAGNAERLDGLAMGVGLDAPPEEVLQLRLAVVALLLVYGAFKFVWSNRLFGYCAVVMASVPNDPSDPRTLPRAGQAAELNVRAALNFNRGLRAVYFAFAALGWLLGPWGLLAAVAVTVWTVLSREFASTSRGVLMED